MNKSYRIDKEHVFVTEADGKVSKMPKFEQVEEILQVQNDLEAICILLDQKHSQIRQNNRRRFDIPKLKIFHHLAIALTVLSVGVTMFGFVSALGFCSAAISLFAVTLSAYCMDKEKHAEIEDERLMANITYLNKMKDQKEATLKALKCNINPQKQEQAETNIVPQSMNLLQILEEVLKVLQQMELENVSMSDVMTVLNATQEINKQKTLGSK